jgi:predicted transcriptional regulator|nr:hypothetical protein [Nitrosomonas nitrosa]
MGRPRGKKTAVRFSVGFDDVTADELAQLAQANDTTVAWVVRRAVSEFIRKKDSISTGVPLRQQGAAAAGQAQ